MSDQTFIIANGAVVWLTTHGPLRLHQESVDGLLDIMEREGEARLFNELHTANEKLTGIPRVSSFRKPALRVVS